MEKLWENLNDYDLWGIIYPGILCNITIYAIYKCVFVGLRSFDLNNFANVIAFIFISYFVGIVLQEIGSIFQEVIFFRNDLPSDTFLLSKSKILSEEEINKFIKEIENDPGYYSYVECLDEKKCRMIFNYVNASLAIKGLSSKCDRMHVIFRLSRSLFFSFLINTIYLIIMIIFFYKNIIISYAIIWILVCFIAMVILYRRTKRFANIRVQTACLLFYIELIKDTIKQ